MRVLSVLLIILLACCARTVEKSDSTVSLAGEWQFRADPDDEGISGKWFESELPETIILPGSMAESGKGSEVGLNTSWTGDIIDKSFFNDARYEKYRQPGNFKVPFWLQPDKYYKGVAWYQKDIEFDEQWKGKRIILNLERPHWETTVFVNGTKAGTDNSLATAHRYEITSYTRPGKNRLTIRVDNRMVVPVGVNSHSVSDHTQSNWNGIAGDINLSVVPSVFIRKIEVHPDIPDRMAKITITVRNQAGKLFDGDLVLQAQSINTGSSDKISPRTFPAVSGEEEFTIVAEYPMGDDFELWDEFNPVLYDLTVSLRDDEGREIQTGHSEFGMREFRADGTRFIVNGNEVFLRGTLECCIFPLTGYPPTDLKSWEKVLGTCKDYGLNTIRFHSWCPPEAAFAAADRLGMYFHIECSSWANQGTALGEGGIIDDYIYREGDRILEAYGNHPSFCMLAYGNEPAGAKQSEYLGKLLSYWKTKDDRRLYTSAAGWPFIPENDYNLSPEPRIQRWGEGLKSIINREAPQTMFDYRDYVSAFRIPVVSHEIGQWCVYPDYSEIQKYTGVLKAKNFEIFRESLEENGIGSQAGDFLMASGKLQALCYKADIEAALRTPGFAGFHLLQLHDFPGQGSALVGILNPFFESKGYVKPEEFRMFCNTVVPLARLKKHVYQNNEVINAEIEVANFGPSVLENEIIACRIISKAGDTLFTRKTRQPLIRRGNCIPLGTLSYRFENIRKPRQFRLDVSIEGTEFHNSWDLWVYPENVELNGGKVYVTDKLDDAAESVLKDGGSVLYLAFGKIAEGRGKEVAVGFSSIFWNTAWTNNQPPHTLGILCDPENPAFGSFPTEYHSNWQWWDPVAHSQAMILNGFPASLRPIIQPVDDWFRNRKLALAFEAKSAGGKIIVCSIDMKNLSEDRLATKQLMSSFLNYMNSKDFNPDIELEISNIRGLSVRK